VVEEDNQEDVEHAGLGILCADFDHLFAVGDGCLCGAFQVHVLLDELNRAISAGDHRLHAGTGEPVNDGSAHHQAKQEWSVQNAQVPGDGSQVNLGWPLGSLMVASTMMIEKIIVVGTHDGKCRSAPVWRLP